MATGHETLVVQGRAAKDAARKLAHVATNLKNKALLAIANGLEDHNEHILLANQKDYSAARRQGLSEALCDRLLLTPKRIYEMAQSVLAIAALPDPVGEIFDSNTLPNGLQVSKRRVPLGVVGAIYESRPNVTVEIACLCLKSGNAVILRGGREAFHSNTAMIKLLRDSIASVGISREAIQLVASTKRSLVEKLLQMDDVIDLLIPRGGAELQRFVSKKARMPVVIGGIGVSHTYIDRDADLKKAVDIAYNAKVQRPTVCNALDTLLIHNQIAPTILPEIAKVWAQAGVGLRCDTQSMDLLQEIPGLQLRAASNEDWGHEFLALSAAVKVVGSLEEALEHIERHGSGNTEAIVTEGPESAREFLDRVDAAVVLVNASTRFTDGGQLGLGGEVAISTNRLHARGPMGLRELTTYKWTVLGSGQVRV